MLVTIIQIFIKFYRQYILIYFNINLNFLNYIYDILNNTYLNVFSETWDVISLNYLYILFFFIILFSSLGVILSKNPVHSVFFLILVFLHIGFFLLMLHIEFLAFLLFIVYLGAIAVLFLFVIMMFNIYILESRDNILRYLPLVLLIILIILEICFVTDIITFNEKNYLFNDLYFVQRNWYVLQNGKENMIILSILYDFYLYHFILASLILLVAMIGAIILTLNQNLNLKKQIYYKQNMKNVYNSLSLRNKGYKIDIWKLYLKKRNWKKK